MAPADLDTSQSIKSSAEAARAFVEHYYSQLNQGRPVAMLHVNVTAAYPAAGHEGAIIVANGAAVASPREWDAMLERQRQPRGQQQQDASTTATATATPSTTTTTATQQLDGGANNLVRYEVESFNVHVLDRDYRFAMPANFPPDTGGAARIMMVVSVVGTVALRSASLSASSAAASPASSATTGGGGGGGMVTRSASYLPKGGDVIGAGAGAAGGGGGGAGIETRGFSDTFILVPNWDLLARPAAAVRGPRKYLIASHTYRTFRVMEGGGAEGGGGAVAEAAVVGAQGIAKAGGAEDGLGFTGFVWGAE